MERAQVERRELWQQRIVEQEKSGGSIRAYCKGIGIPEHAFYGWRQRLRAEMPVTFALVETKQPTKEAVLIEVVLAQGDRLRIPGDEATLRLVLGVLREQR
jgi:hypothetical protein